ncbi:MAG: Arginase [Xylophilus sp.]|nr:MAG: Arginase [Xylophilus sp.]
MHDRGNLASPHHHPGSPPQDGLRNLPECIAWSRLVHDAVGAALHDGHLPVLLGGDHHPANGSISAVAGHRRRQGRRLRILWLDAHADCNTQATTTTGNVHGTPVASLLGLGSAELARLSGERPAIQPQQLCQIGLRSVDAAEKLLLAERGMEVYDMRAIDELGMRAVMGRALQEVGPGVHLHLSFDIDFLDPDIAPGTGTTVRGGPGYREAQLCMEIIADTGALASLDIMELNPALDIRNQTA